MVLKSLGYPKICAYSYGLPNNDESKISRTVATQLGIPWHFIPYTHESWAQWHTLQEWKAYIRFAERLTSLAHFQDWPAVMVLKEKRILDEESVIVPGHSGDFLAGKQIPKVLLSPPSNAHCSDILVDAVLKRHYNLRSIGWTAKYLGLDKRQLLREIRYRIKSHFQGYELKTASQRVDAFDYEFWQEWLSKVIVNSVRVYEFMGMDWWLPFYDSEYVGFWERVPLKMRLNKLLYNHSVKSIQIGLGVTSKAYGPSTTFLKTFLKSLALKTKYWDFIYELYWRVYKRKHDYFNHFLGWYGIVDYRTYSYLLKRGGSFNTLVSFEQVNNYLNKSRKVLHLYKESS